MRWDDLRGAILGKIELAKANGQTPAVRYNLELIDFLELEHSLEQDGVLPPPEEATPAIGHILRLRGEPREIVVRSLGPKEWDTGGPVEQQSYPGRLTAPKDSPHSGG